MKAIGTILCGCTLAVITGCAPQLAQSPLGPQEYEWSMYLKDAYPEWDAPKTMPPVQKLEEEQPAVEMTETVLDDAPVAEFETPMFEAVVTPEATAADISVVEEPIDNGGDEIHTVVKGDSLWTVSKQYYMTGTKWRSIYDANKEVINDPNRLKPGMQLRIPR